MISSMRSIHAPTHLIRNNRPTRITMKISTFARSKPNINLGLVYNEGNKKGPFFRPKYQPPEGKYRSFVNGAFHTNGIENFCSLFKRGIIGIYHQVSNKHLQRYADEFAYRYNTRHLIDADMLETVLTHTQGRLKYKDLTKKERGLKSPFFITFI